MKTITAKYPGRRGRAILADTVDLATVAALDPELVESDPDAALVAGRYMARSMARGVSDIWTAGGREYYRNRRGLCEDAPCCGCCNA